MQQHAESKGSLMILVQALLWGLFPVVTIVLFDSLPPLFTLAGGTFFSGIFFALIISVKKRWRELKNTKAWPDLFLTAVLLGIADIQRSLR